MHPPHPHALGLAKHETSRFVTARASGLVITRVLLTEGEEDVSALPSSDRPRVWCPFCGTEGRYAKGRGADGSPIDHFVHGDDAADCLESSLQTVLHRRSLQVLLDGLARLRVEGKPLVATVKCLRCAKELRRAVLEAHGWDAETAFEELPGVHCLKAEAVSFSLKLLIGQSPEVVPGENGPPGLELNATELFTPEGESSWTGEGALPLAVTEWNLERAPRGFSVCHSCRRSSDDLRALDQVLARLRRENPGRGDNLLATFCAAAGASEAPVDGNRTVAALVARPESFRPLAVADTLASTSEWPNALEVIARFLEQRRPEDHRGSLSEFLKDPYGPLTRAMAQEKLDQDPEVKPRNYLEALQFVDAVARYSGVDHLHTRFEAYATFRALKVTPYGHTALGRKRLIWQLSRDLELSQREVNKLAGEINLVTLVRKYHPVEGHVFVLPLLAKAEATLAKRLHHRSQSIPVRPPKHQEPLNAGQRRAITNALQQKLSIVTGGPGTGKTHLLGALLRTIASLDPKARVVFAAPTHKAVQRITESLGESAAQVRTVHSWLRRAADLKEDPPWLMVVDEAGFLDSLTAAELMDVAFHAQRVLLVGDPDQLPSIAPGAVLRDCIELFPTLVERLTEQMRAADGRGLIEAAYAIAAGQVPTEAPGVRILAPGADAGTVAYEQVAAFREAGMEPEQVQVLAPTNKLVGAINLAIQNRFNPLGKPVPGPNRLRVGDRVVCTQTVLEEKLTNGRQGYIRQAAVAGAMIEWDGEPAPVLVGADHLENVAPAYAMTVHKSQGSEWKHVVVVLGDDNWFERSLLYTAATRAKETLLGTGPTQRQHLQVLLALGQVDDPRVAPHVREVLLRLDLEDHLHPAFAAGALGVLHSLDPVGPAAQLVSLQGLGDLLRLQLPQRERSGLQPHRGTAQLHRPGLEVIVVGETQLLVLGRRGEIVPGLPADDRLGGKGVLHRRRRLGLLGGLHHPDRVQLAKRHRPAHLRLAVLLFAIEGLEQSGGRQRPARPLGQRAQVQLQQQPQRPAAVTTAGVLGPFRQPGLSPIAGPVGRSSRLADLRDPRRAAVLGNPRLQLLEDLLGCHRAPSKHAGADPAGHLRPSP
ncbi:MAG: AAA family ATPase [Myxococcota bacterium]|nr:AAA family ATPase [Myxococcota bacterium]